MRAPNAEEDLDTTDARRFFKDVAALRASDVTNATSIEIQ
jgi:hypothetical protein